MQHSAVQWHPTSARRGEMLEYYTVCVGVHVYIEKMSHKLKLLTKTIRLFNIISYKWDGVPGC